MAHGPVTDWGEDKASSYKTRLGLKMILIYGVIYAVFILINTLAPQVMAMEVLFGINLAVYYGAGLIIFAILQGILYNHLCTRKEKQLNTAGAKKKKKGRKKKAPKGGKK